MFVTFEQIDNELTRLKLGNHIFYSVFNEEENDYLLYEFKLNTLRFLSVFDSFILIVRHIQSHYIDEDIKQPA